MMRAFSSLEDMMRYVMKLDTDDAIQRDKPLTPTLRTFS